MADTPKVVPGNAAAVICLLAFTPDSFNMALIKELFPAFWAPTTHASPLEPIFSDKSVIMSLTPVPFTLLTRCTAAGDGRPACLQRLYTQSCVPKKSGESEGFNLATQQLCHAA